MVRLSCMRKGPNTHFIPVVKILIRTTKHMYQQIVKPDIKSFSFRYGDKTPKTIFARILCVVWILAGAVLLSLFTANTTSIITEGRMKKNAQTMGKKVNFNY